MNRASSYQKFKSLNKCYDFLCRGVLCPLLTFHKQQLVQSFFANLTCIQLLNRLLFRVCLFCNPKVWLLMRQTYLTYLLEKKKVTNVTSIFRGVSRVILKTTYLKVRFQAIKIHFQKEEKKELMITGINMTYWEIINVAFVAGSHS